MKTKMLYHQDNYLTEFKASLLSLNEEENYLILDQTLFYPGGGNQIFDIGHLVVNDSKLEINKVKKNRKSGVIYHFYTLPKESKLNQIRKGALITGYINWERRYQVMKTHTTQHLFSRLLKDRLNAETLNVYNCASHGEIRISKAIEVDDILKIQDEINEHIKTGVKVNREALDGRYIIDIESLDRRECGGCHVNNLHEINAILVTSYQEDKICFKIGQESIDSFKSMQRFALTFKHLKGMNELDASKFLSQKKAEQLEIEKFTSLYRSEFFKKAHVILNKFDSDQFVKRRIGEIDFFVIESQGFKVKEMQVFLNDQLKTLSSRVVICICKNDAILIMSNSRCNAKMILNMIKDEITINGGGSKAVAQGGPIEVSPSQLVRLIETKYYSQNFPLFDE